MSCHSAAASMLRSHVLVGVVLCHLSSLLSVQPSCPPADQHSCATQGVCKRNLSGRSVLPEPLSLFGSTCRASHLLCQDSLEIKVVTEEMCLLGWADNCSCILLLKHLYPCVCTCLLVFSFSCFKDLFGWILTAAPVWDHEGLSVLVLTVVLYVLSISCLQFRTKIIAFIRLSFWLLKQQIPILKNGKEKYRYKTVYGVTPFHSKEISVRAQELGSVS